MADRNICRVCGAEVDLPSLDLTSPAITTTNQTLDMPTRVYVCPSCAHVQSPELPDLAAYYDTSYKISLDSEDHDQLYEVRDGAPVYRTDRQAEVVLEKAVPPRGARVLDYGAGKAQTLRKILARRPDISPHVFDVSDDYRQSWSAWLIEDATASYAAPETWRGRFDLVTSHYVLEHVPNPVEALRSLATLLAPGGRIFFSIPDWTQNNGDLLVADHINHFTRASILRLAAEAGLIVDDLDDSALPSAFTVTCSVAGAAASRVPQSEVDAAADQARETARALTESCRRLDLDLDANAKRSAAIFGAGFYGAFLLTRMGGRIPVERCLDSNHFLWGKTLFDVPIGPPDSLPDDVEVVYVGLNPARARAIAASVPALQRPGLDLVFFDA